MDESFEKIPHNVRSIVFKDFKELRRVQQKALDFDIFSQDGNVLVSSPTGSGKTLVSEFLLLDTILNKRKKVIYIVPLRALASEKFKEMKQRYSELFKVRISVGDVQNEFYNLMYDLLIVTAEKLDSLIRNNKNFLENLGLLIVDEIHLLNDEYRGPTLEIILTLFKSLYPHVKICGLSATISNAQEIASWLRADLVKDSWRPTKLEHLTLVDKSLKRYK